MNAYFFFWVVIRLLGIYVVFEISRRTWRIAIRTVITLAIILVILTMELPARAAEPPPRPRATLHRSRPPNYFFLDPSINSG